MAQASFIAEPLEQRQLLAFVNTANELTKISDVIGQELVQAGDLFFFIETLSNNTRKVWRSDGTTAGTFRVSEVNQGASFNTGLSQFGVIGDRVFFAADDGVHGVELWTSDGTTAGTRMVADINPGSASSNPGNLAVADGRVYFAADNGTLGREPWSADANGAALVADVRAGATGSNPTDFFTVNNSVLFFAKETTRFLNLYSSVNQSAPIAVARFPEFTQGPFESAVVGDRAYFFVPMFSSVVGPGTFLWYTDGTATGTRQITRRVSPESSNSGVRFSPVAFGDQLIFRGQDNVNGWEPWTSDGTESGTQIIKDINPGIADGIPYPGQGLFIQLGNELFFNALAPVHGKELWSTDGTQFNTRLVRDMTPTDHTFPNKFGLVGDQIWFNTFDRGIALSDGTSAGTVFLDHRDSMPVGRPIGLRGSPISRGDDVFLLTEKGFYKAAAVDNLPPVVNATTTSHSSVPYKAAVFFSEDIRNSLTFDEILVRNVATGARVDLSPQDIAWDQTLGRYVSISFNSYMPNLPDGNYRLSIPAGAVQDVWGNASQTDWSIDFFALEADFNHDRWIDSRDFSLFASNFNMPAGYAGGDLNRSGRVDIADFALFAPKFNTYLAPPAAPRAAQPSSREMTRAFSAVPVSTREMNLIQTDEEILSSITNH